MVKAKMEMMTDTGDLGLYLCSGSVYVTLPDAKGRNYRHAQAYE